MSRVRSCPPARRRGCPGGPLRRRAPRRRRRGRVGVPDAETPPGFGSRPADTLVPDRGVGGQVGERAPGGDGVGHGHVGSIIARPDRGAHGRRRDLGGGDPEPVEVRHHGPGGEGNGEVAVVTGVRGVHRPSKAVLGALGQQQTLGLRATGVGGDEEEGGVRLRCLERCRVGKPGRRRTARSIRRGPRRSGLARRRARSRRPTPRPWRRRRGWLADPRPPRHCRGRRRATSRPWHPGGPDPGSVVKGVSWAAASIAAAPSARWDGLRPTRPGRKMAASGRSGPGHPGWEPRPRWASQVIDPVRGGEPERGPAGEHDGVIASTDRLGSSSATSGWRGHRRAARRRDGARRRAGSLSPRLPSPVQCPTAIPGTSVSAPLTRRRQSPAAARARGRSRRRERWNSSVRSNMMLCPHRRA